MRRQPNPEAVQKDPNNPVSFGPPILSPGVTDPRAAAYVKGLTERHGPARYTAPVGGEPLPQIPRLDAPPMGGLTMADEAALQRVGHTPAPVVQPPVGGIFQGTAPPRAQAAPPGPSRPNILPSDILPNEALQDPEFREGSGARYASAQPHLALKYGVIRSGQRVAPQQLNQAQKGLSSASLDDLKRLSDLQAAQAGAAPHPLLDNDEKRIEREAAAGTAGAAARSGAPVVAPSMSLEEKQEAIKNMDDFDFNAFRERLMKDILNNEDQKKLIEARCAPLSFDDLLTKGYVTQRVPILPGKFEPEFQSISGTDDLTIKRMIMEESKALEVSDRYLLDKFALMGLVLGVRAINNNPLPDFCGQNGRFNEEKFWVKFNLLSRYPQPMLASLGANYFWFDVRVRTLFVASNLGGG